VGRALGNKSGVEVLVILSTHCKNDVLTSFLAPNAATSLKLRRSPLNKMSEDLRKKINKEMNLLT